MNDRDLIECVWTGDTFRPATPFMRRRAEDKFGEGELVMMNVENDRSARSHNHYFAAIGDLWANLPLSLSNMPYAKSPGALRKHGLIECGYADCETIDAVSNAAAERIAASVGRLATLAHGYAIVSVQGPVVRVFTPQSQAVREMGGRAFQESKTKVLAWIEDLLAGVHT